MWKVLITLLAVFVARAAAWADASTEAPGGLPPDRTPQFVLLTHDDAIKSNTYDMMTSITDGRASLDVGRGSCAAAATFFTTTSGTSCDRVMDLYWAGHEIADHTVNHVSLLKASDGEVSDQILGARDKLVDCGVPQQDVVGFRAPYLDTRPLVRQILSDNGFLYDSTMMEEGSGRSLSGGMDDRVWPWDMQHGMPINWRWYGGSQKVDDGEDWPGLWQVPVWEMGSDDDYTMDYGDDGAVDVFEFLKQNFDDAYNGNRAPFPIFIHSPWLKSHKDAVARFADYALSQPDVYFVTIRQLIAWMKNPVAADELTPGALGCGSPGGAGPASVATNQPGGINTYVGNAEEGSFVSAPAPSPAPVPAPAPAPEPSSSPSPSPESQDEGVIADDEETQSYRRLMRSA